MNVNGWVLIVVGDCKLGAFWSDSFQDILVLFDQNQNIFQVNIYPICLFSIWSDSFAVFDLLLTTKKIVFTEMKPKFDSIIVYIVGESVQSENDFDILVEFLY